MDKWCGDARYGCYQIRADETLKKRLRVLAEWQRQGGVCVIGFEAFLTLVARRGAAASPHLQARAPKVSIATRAEGRGCSGALAHMSARRGCSDDLRLALAAAVARAGLDCVGRGPPHQECAVEAARRALRGENAAPPHPHR